MAVTLKELSSWLDNKEFNYEVLEDKDIIILGFLGKDDLQCGVRIELHEDGELLQVYSNLLINKDKNVLKLKDHEHSFLVLQHMLKINYDEKFGTWEFDPNDGEIRFAFEIPLVDAIMTEKQFNRIIDHIFNSDSGFSEILKIIETGELEESTGIDDFMIRMLEEHIEQLSKQAEEPKKKTEDNYEDGI